VILAGGGSDSRQLRCLINYRIIIIIIIIIINVAGVLPY